jgi:hypothetical protein
MTAVLHPNPEFAPAIANVPPPALIAQRIERSMHIFALCEAGRDDDAAKLLLRFYEDDPGILRHFPAAIVTEFLKAHALRSVAQHRATQQTGN